MATEYQPQANFNGSDKNVYMGNKNLPTSKAEFEWTPKMVADLKKCGKNLLYFAENFFTIVNLDRGREKITLFKCQKKVLRALRDNRFNIVLASRQVGKTTMMTIYTLWVACFLEDQRILVVANKEQTAINIFKRIRLAYEQLPNWLKPGVVEYRVGRNKGSSYLIYEALLLLLWDHYVTTDVMWSSPKINFLLLKMVR